MSFTNFKFTHVFLGLSLFCASFVAVAEDKIVLPLSDTMSLSFIPLRSDGGAAKFRVELSIIKEISGPLNDQFTVFQKFQFEVEHELFQEVELVAIPTNSKLADKIKPFQSKNILTFVVSDDTKRVPFIVRHADEEQLWLFNADWRSNDQRLFMQVLLDSPEEELHRIRSGQWTDKYLSEVVYGRGIPQPDSATVLSRFFAWGVESGFSAEYKKRYPTFAFWDWAFRFADHLSTDGLFEGETTDTQLGIIANVLNEDRYPLYRPMVEFADTAPFALRNQNEIDLLNRFNRTVLLRYAQINPKRVTDLLKGVDVAEMGFLVKTDMLQFLATESSEKEVRIAALDFLSKKVFFDLEKGKNVATAVVVGSETLSFERRVEIAEAFVRSNSFQGIPLLSNLIIQLFIDEQTDFSQYQIRAPLREDLLMILILDYPAAQGLSQLLKTLREKKDKDYLAILEKSEQVRKIQETLSCEGTFLP